MRKFFASKDQTVAESDGFAEPVLRPVTQGRGAAIADGQLSAAGFDAEDEPASPPKRIVPDRKARGLRQLRRPRAATVFGAAFGALMVAIGVNAVALQKERHPAPWFDKTPHGEESAPRQGAAQPAAPARAAPQQSAALAPEPAPPVPPPPAPVTKPRPPERPRDATASVDRRPKDPIGDLLKAGKTPAASPEPSAAVAAIQRTLARLGYSVVVDGVIGAATQRAIAQFEHDHRLPVKGQLTARLFQEITAAAKP